ncbi:hypothetical protein [Clostridium septicum]|uniref:Uncharacterized protein n=1 Tax=Clostridium septicum TaxID=1504 RepID=A0ABY5AZ95_CLOSE|nr:hypothetical protein [Clostridium septicum]MDU1313419.1 hypothetical protein [Clostridium septicum]UEC19457.1 hypothetical protein LK444_08450 [Clostridium septicum]USR99590.1 hypothetical protein NH397_08735 [Clostridium septicum]
MFTVLIFALLIRSIPSSFLLDTVLLNGIIKILSDGFLTIIKMMVVPLVLISLT